MKNKLTTDILEKYFKGDCSENEIAEINSWYESFEHDDGDISDLSDIEKEGFRVLMLNNIRKNINAEEIDSIVSLRKIKPIRSLFYFLAGSAAAILLVFFIKYRMPNKPQITTNEEMVIDNMTNTIQKITLSDGSRVWLSPKSQLTYPKILGAHSRRVAMIGEAFFEVTKDHKRPFSIFSGNVVTKVWGTSFRICSYKNEATKVDVVTGKVSVSITKPDMPTPDLNKSDEIASTKEVMLTPNEEATYDKKQNDLKRHTTISDSTINIWKKTNIAFDNTPMTDVFKILSKKFKVHIWSADKKVNSDFLNADFTNESLPSIMEMLKNTMDVNYAVTGSEFVLISNR